jgi:hypothetical protein
MIEGYFFIFIFICLDFILGRGFGVVKAGTDDRIYIEAILNGSVLDTELFPITEEPIIHSEFVWELNKKLFRRYIYL